MRIIIILAFLSLSSYAFAETYNDMADTIKTTVGEEFVITLDANTTTGYEWQLSTPIDDKTINLVRSEYVPDKTVLVGSGGKSIWTFKAVRAGKAQISLKYIRPWEKDTPPVKEVTYTVDIQNEGLSGTVEEKIWALEEAYFANLYKADYEAVLALVHSQFLGWPGAVPQPIDKDGSARFMKQLISKPTSCTFKIERGGIRVLGELALTQYTIHVNCPDTAAAAKTQSSRITHTWVKESDRWKLLGGMSYDQ